MKPQGHRPTSASPSAHEGADLNVPLVVRTAILVAITLAILIVAVTLLFHVFNRIYSNRTSEAAPRVTAQSLPPAPRLQVNPASDLEIVHAQENLHLEHYAWMDKQRGIAQVPIERAMDLWVKTYQPAPVSATIPQAAKGMTELQMRQEKAQKAGHAP